MERGEKQSRLDALNLIGDTLDLSSARQLEDDSGSEDSSDDDCYENDGFGADIEYDGTCSEVELQDDEVADESESHDEHSYQLEDNDIDGK